MTGYAARLQKRPQDFWLIHNSILLLVNALIKVSSSHFESQITEAVGDETYWAESALSR
jgi:hypothetical protein